MSLPTDFFFLLSMLKNKRRCIFQHKTHSINILLYHFMPNTNYNRSFNSNYMNSNIYSASSLVTWITPRERLQSFPSTLAMTSALKTYQVYISQDLFKHSTKCSESFPATHWLSLQCIHFPNPCIPSECSHLCHLNGHSVHLSILATPERDKIVVRLLEFSSARQSPSNPSQTIRNESSLPISQTTPNATTNCAVT